MDLKYLLHVSIPLWDHRGILVTLVLHYFMLPEDDPIEGLKHVGDILNPF